MRTHQVSRPRHANLPKATGVPPVPPEDSPKADLWRERRLTPGSGGRMDVQQSVTDRIVAMLERGGNVFHERWTRAASRGMPRNGKNGAPYHGANVLLLWDAAIEQGYASNVWLTYKQAASLGAQVRRGERAVLCAHFERKADKGPSSPSDMSNGTPDLSEKEGGVTDIAEGTERSFLLCRPFWLFNVAQIDGLPSELIDACSDAVAPACGPVEAAFRLLGGSGAVIRHGFAQAMYVPALDEIRLPWPKRFTSAEAYCATTLHELVHWTGHPDRLGRAFGRRFGDDAYAFEELVAELGSAFAMGHCGLVNASIEGHVAYLDSWLQVLRNDRTAIFTAARHAGEAFEFILAREMPALDGAPALPTEA